MTGWGRSTEGMGSAHPPSPRAKHRLEREGAFCVAGSGLVLHEVVTAQGSRSLPAWWRGCSYVIYAMCASCRCRPLRILVVIASACLSYSYSLTDFRGLLGSSESSSASLEGAWRPIPSGSKHPRVAPPEDGTSGCRDC